MDKTEFKKLLFKVAFCTMACDGHIDKREIEELKIIGKNTTFFDNIDLFDELSELVKSLDKKGTKIIEELFDSLSKTELNPIQELIILEVALRIINADEIQHENEVRFINLIRGKLEVHDEIINDRFGKLEILHTNEYSRNITSKSLESFNLPKVSNIKDLGLKLD